MYAFFVSGSSLSKFQTSCQFARNFSLKLSSSEGGGAPFTAGAAATDALVKMPAIPLTMPTTTSARRFVRSASTEFNKPCSVSSMVLEVSIAQPPFIDVGMRYVLFSSGTPLVVTVNPLSEVLLPPLPSQGTFASASWKKRALNRQKRPGDFTVLPTVSSTLRTVLGRENGMPLAARTPGLCETGFLSAQAV